jgi:serine/threonine protein kinase
MTTTPPKNDAYGRKSVTDREKMPESARAKSNPYFRRTCRVVWPTRKLPGVASLAGGAKCREKGIIHRDVTPANVLIDKQGEPHLLDFGLARLEQSSERMTQTGSVMGTPVYMSPEQAAGKHVTSASDQYSLGATFYELITGQAPYSGPLAIVIFNVLKDGPPGPRTVEKEIPRNLEIICQKAMARDADQRYVNCLELADDLMRWLGNQPIRARRVPRSGHFILSFCKNPLVVILTTVLVLIIGSNKAALIIEAVSEWWRRRTSPTIVYRDRPTIVYEVVQRFNVN